DVVVDPRDDLAQRRTGVESRGEALEMAVERQPHVEEHRGRNGGVAQPAGVVDEEVQDRQEERQPDDSRQRLEVTSEERLVDEQLRQVGKRQSDDRTRKAQEQYDR